MAAMEKPEERYVENGVSGKEGYVSDGNEPQSPTSGTIILTFKAQ